MSLSPLTTSDSRLTEKSWGWNEIYERKISDRIQLRPADMWSKAIIRQLAFCYALKKTIRSSNTPLREWIISFSFPNISWNCRRKRKCRSLLKSRWERWRDEQCTEQVEVGLEECLQAMVTGPYSRTIERWGWMRFLKWKETKWQNSTTSLGPDIRYAMLYLSSKAETAASEDALCSTCPP